MARKVVEPEMDKNGTERHPSWGMIGAGRVQVSPPGAALFDSDIHHMHAVTIQISTASRKRDLNRDWLHAEREFIRIEMSEAQWASFVSSMGIGNGVPCTILHREDEYEVPAAPFEPRMQESMDEVRNAADKAIAKVAEAFETYEAKPTKANLRHLKAMIANLPANVTFAAEKLVEHAENVVQRSKADIEAMAMAEAQRLGINPVTVHPQLEAPKPSLGEVMRRKKS